MAQFINRPSYNTTLPREPITFFGTGIVSLKSLQHIAKSYDIEAVVTLTDRSSSSNRKVPSLVKEWSQQNKIRVIEVSNKAELTRSFEQASLLSRLGIVVDFGIVLPSAIIDYFPLGIINSHFSLLPQWRGADPITFALLSGQPKTGISIMQVDSGLDTGDIIDTAELTINPSDTTTTLTDRLITLSNSTLDETLTAILAGKTYQTPQDGIPTYSRKLTKSDGQLNWDKSAKQLVREIQAYTGWPSSYTTIDNQHIIVKSASTQPCTTQKAGVFFIAPDKKLAVSCGNSSLLIFNQLQPAGKKPMSSDAFLVGRQAFRSSLDTIGV